MNEADVISLVREGLMTALVIGGPGLAAATFVGLAIALFQALTQIQEVTLTFVPKIVAITVTVMVALPFMFLNLQKYTDLLADVIVNGRG